MTRIKLCGLMRPCDIEAANELMPEYVGFVFAPGSRRCVTKEQAAALKALLSPEIMAVGVFVDEKPETVADLLREGIIDMAQLHGREDAAYIRRLRALTRRPLIQAFRMGAADAAAERDVADAATAEDGGSNVLAAEESAADLVLLDSGAGCGRTFHWELAKQVKRPYFLAGGLDAKTVGSAIRLLHPFAVDVSSGIETDGRKDREKMAAFVAAVRKEGK